MSGQVSKNDASGFKAKGGTADILNAVNMEHTQEALIDNVNSELQETAKTEALAVREQWEASQKRAQVEDDEFDDDDFLNDAEAQDLQNKRLQAMQQKCAPQPPERSLRLRGRRSASRAPARRGPRPPPPRVLWRFPRRYALERQLQAAGHGEYREITEEEFLKEVCGSQWVVVHFHHHEFFRCKIVDKHLRIIAQQKNALTCKFLTLNAEKCAPNRRMRELSAPHASCTSGMSWAVVLAPRRLVRVQGNEPPPRHSPPRRVRVDLCALARRHPTPHPLPIPNASPLPGGTLLSGRAPFFVAKLAVQMLPTIIVFKDGIVHETLAGFDDLGAKDEFRTEVRHGTQPHRHTALTATAHAPLPMRRCPPNTAHVAPPAHRTHPCTAPTRAPHPPAHRTARVCWDRLRTLMRARMRDDANAPSSTASCVGGGAPQVLEHWFSKAGCLKMKKAAIAKACANSDDEDENSDDEED